MKKTILVAALCVASSASWAVALCTATGVGVPWTVANPPAGFTKAGFSPKCSANTYVTYLEGANTAAVGATSKKGNQIFAGHTNGGAVGLASGTSTCASAAACTDTEATTAATTALANSSS